jgi:glyoxylase-like metal-dependent hydrolase (beta-lactamase superfamily II)
MLSGIVLDQALVRAAKARAQSIHSNTKLFDIEKVAEDVYAATAKPVTLLNCNAAIFVNANDILVVDAHSKPSAAAAMVAQLRREVSTKPVRYIVNTHFHWDHTQGMPHYRSAAPGADVVASSATRRLIETQALDRLKASMQTTQADLENLKRQSPKTDAERTYQKMAIADMESYLREMQGYQPDLPNITFDDGLLIRDKNHEILVAFRGRGHTDGDVVVFSPQKKVIATGDQLHGFVPWLDDGYPLEWPTTLRKYGELDFQTVIGGHGPVQNTRDRLPQTVAYIEEITDAVRRGKQASKNVAELERAITLASLRSLTGTGYGKFIEDSLSRFWPLKPGDTAADQLAVQVKGNVQALFNKL